MLCCIIQTFATDFLPLIDFCATVCVSQQQQGLKSPDACGDALYVNCPIQPKDINIGGEFWNAFNKSETEVSARQLVRFCQSRGDWSGFTKAALDKFVEEDFWFNGLMTVQGNQTKQWTWLIKKGSILGPDELIFPSLEFVAVCYCSSPVITALEVVGNHPV